MRKKSCSWYNTFKLAERKPKMKRLVVLGSILATVCAASAATTYYWTGAADAGNAKCAFFTAGNWAKVDGSVATAAPVEGDTVIFTNDTALTLSASKNLPSFTWRFEGTGNVMGPGLTDGSNKSYTFKTGSSIYAAPSEGAEHKLDYTVTLTKNMGDFPVEVGAGTTLWLSGYGTTWVQEGTRLIKKGPGTQKHFRLYWYGPIRLEDGEIYANNSGSDLNATLEVVGPGLKKLGAGDNNLVIQEYHETDDALNTMSFYACSTAADYFITLKGKPDTVTRCSAEVRNDGTKYHRLIWDPENNACIDFVGRLHNSSKGKIYVKSGRARFAENAGVKALNELRVGSGTEVEISRTATNDFSGVSVLLEEGATLKVDGVKSNSYPDDKSTAADFYPSSLQWNGLMEVCGERRVYLNNPAASKFGANAALKFSGSGEKRFNIYSGKCNVNLSNYVESVESEGRVLLTCYTSQANTFTINGSEDTRFTADIWNTAGGTFQLIWNPMDATKTLTVAKRVYGNSRPRFRVMKGTMRFAEGAAISSNSSIVTVDAGATFSFAPDCGVGFPTTTIELADETSGIEVVGAGTRIILGSVTVGGVAVDPGIYKSGDFTWLKGEGALIVGMSGTEPETVTATWTGGGETAAINDPANWGGTLPNLTDGSVVAVFPAGVTSAIVPATGGYVLKGLVFNEPGFTLDGDPISVLLLGSEGIRLPDRAEKAYYDIDCPIFMTHYQEWKIGTNCVLRLNENAELTTGVSGIAMAQVGLKGEVEYRATSERLIGDIKIARGIARVYADNAFGGAQRKLVQGNDSLIQLFGCTLDCAVQLQGGGRETHLEAVEGTNVLNGLVTPEDSNESQYACRAGAKIVFRGGTKYDYGNNGASWTPVGAFDISVENTPVDVTKVALGEANQDTAFHLNVASNRFPRGLFLWHNAKSNVLYTEVPYALYPDGTGGVSFHSDAKNGVWDLCGCDQGVSIYFSRTTDAIVKSDEPATLHLVDDALNYVKLTEPSAYTMKCTLLGTASQVDRTTFAGVASFSKEGVLKHYMMGASTSTGGVYVTKGELVFTKASSASVTLPQEKTGMSGSEASGYAFTPLTGSWKNASEAVVTGGTLTLEHGQVFGKATDVKVSGDGVINLAAGVVQKCHTLTIGETVCDSGTWGGPESDAEHKDAHFAGTGVLRVVGDGLGLILFFR